MEWNPIEKEHDGCCNNGYSASDIKRNTVVIGQVEKPTSDWWAERFWKRHHTVKQTDGVRYSLRACDIPRDHRNKHLVASIKNTKSERVHANPDIFIRHGDKGGRNSYEKERELADLEAVELRMIARNAKGDTSRKSSKGHITC